MTSTSTSIVGSLLLACIALALAATPPAPARPPKPRKVELRVEAGEYYYIIDTGGDGFLALRFRKGERRDDFDNFKPTLDGMVVRGAYMGRDPSGKCKAVLARREWFGPPPDDIKWHKLEVGFSTRLRVPDGPLKGWWVGLGPLRVTKEGRTEAPLVLVKEEKDAVVFRSEDPYDDGK